MPDFFELKKGDPDNFKGRVMIYACNLNGMEKCCVNPLYPMVLVGMNPDELSTIYESLFNEGLPNKNDIVSDYEVDVEENSCAIAKLEDVLKNEKLPFWIKKIRKAYLESEKQCIGIMPCEIDEIIDDEELYTKRVDGDVIFAGHVPYLEHADDLMLYAADAYMTKYKIHAVSPKNELDAVCRNLMDAASTGKRVAAEYYYTIFERISIDKNYAVLISPMKGFLSKPNVLAQMINEIKAVNAEDFEKAAEHRDQLFKLTGKRPNSD